MRIVACLLSLATVIAFSALTDRQAKIRLVWGDDVNVPRAEAILAEEAQKLGMSMDDYLNSCAADVETGDFTEREQADIWEELTSKQGNVNANTWNELFDILKVHAPKTYAALMLRKDPFEKYVAKLDAKAQQFMKKLECAYFLLGNAVLESFNGITQADTGSMKAFDLLALLGKNVKKVKSDYDALPKSSKDSLERIFCVRSTLRIVDEDGLLKAVYALVDAMA